MRKTRVFCIFLVLVMLLGICGCTIVVSDASDGGSALRETELGQGKMNFLLTVTDAKGNESAYRINTDKTTVGDALLELKIIEGEEGPYGMYIRTVNGITADYNDGGKYWAFYIDGEYATSGVDTAAIEEGKTYALKVQR